MLRSRRENKKSREARIAREDERAFPETEPSFEDERTFREKSEFGKGVLTGILLAGIVFLAGLLFRFGTLGRGDSEGAHVLTRAETLSKLGMVASIIDSDSLEQPDANLLEAYLFRGIAAGLDDPYAAYYTKEEQSEVAKGSKGSYRGIGVVFTQYQAAEEMSESGAGESGSGEKAQQKYDVTVTSVYPDSPAEKAGILPGDILKKVEETSVAGGDLDTVMEQISRAFESGESIEMEFLRGEETVVFRVHEEEIALTSVSGELVREGIGYIQIPEFDEVTPKLFAGEVERLGEQNGGKAPDSLIIDVRDNPGGVLESVVAILDDLLDEGVILTSSNAAGEQEHFEAEEGKIYDGKLTVLVNGQSASAAEVFAGVLQYYGAAEIVGFTTFGKGTVQHTYSLPDGSAFKLTSEKYAIAGEKEIDGTGIVPDVEVPETKESAKGEEGDAVLEAALKRL